MDTVHQQDFPKRPRYGEIEEVELHNWKRTPEVKRDKDSLLQDQLHSASRRYARKPTSPTVILQTIFNVILALPSLCFVAFGIIVYLNDGRSAEGDGMSSNLLAAAHYV